MNLQDFNKKLSLIIRIGLKLIVIAIGIAWLIAMIYAVILTLKS